MATLPTNDNKTKAKLHAENLRKQAGEFIGKPGHNPFAWIKTNLAPLESAMDAGDATATDKILALKLDTSVENTGPREVPAKA